jgi:predicted DNA-binding protein (MmcQ/YjbR family)
MADGPPGRDLLLRICDELPEADVRPGQHLKATVRGKTFAYHLDDHHGDGRVAINVKVGPGEQAELVASDPARFFVPAYLGPKGWVGLHLDVGEVDEDEVRELVVDSYRLVAPKRLAAQLDGGG